MEVDRPVFPTFIGGSRRIPPDHDFMDDSNAEREHAAQKLSGNQVPRKDAGKKQEAVATDLLKQIEYSGDHRQKHQCSTCRAMLPSAKLLDIHLVEVHDSFFAAQAARRMRVFQCLVDSCDRRFCTAQERKQHLHDAHKFPRGFNFDRMHLRHRGGQHRPLPHLQKSTAVRLKRPASEADTMSTDGGASPAERPASGLDEDGSGGYDADKEDAAEGMEVADLTAGMSRLSTVAANAAVPRQVAFGRQRRPGLIPGRGSGHAQGNQSMREG